MGHSTINRLSSQRCYFFQKCRTLPPRCFILCYCTRNTRQPTLDIAFLFQWLLRVTQRTQSTVEKTIVEGTKKNLYFVTSKMALLNVLWGLCGGDPTIIHLKNGSQHHKSSFIPAVLNLDIGFSFFNGWMGKHCAIRQTAGGQEGACASGAKGHRVLLNRLSLRTQRRISIRINSPPSESLQNGPGVEQ